MVELDGAGKVCIDVAESVDGRALGVCSACLGSLRLFGFGGGGREALAAVGVCGVSLLRLGMRIGVGWYSWKVREMALTELKPEVWGVSGWC